MKVTRVIVHGSSVKQGRPLCVCSVVFDDCLMINHIRLFQGDNGYYLCFPSKQDIYKEVQDLNKDNPVVCPSQTYDENDEGCKKYDEFYHPLDRMFYYDLRSIIVSAYIMWKETGRSSIKPHLDGSNEYKHVIENAGTGVSWR